jgi:hypothetical protein
MGKRQRDDDDADFTAEDAKRQELSDDHTYGEPGATRPGWRTNRYAILFTKQFRNSVLMCPLCNRPIVLTSNDSAGCEIYGHPLGPHGNPGTKYGPPLQRPPIDHYNPDWVHREATVQSIISHSNPPFPPEHRQKLRHWALNAARLRIVHRECNLRRSKQIGGKFNQEFADKAFTDAKNPATQLRKTWL